MEFLDKLWNDMGRAPVPTASEIRQLGLTEPKEDRRIFENGHVTELYIRLQTLYKYLFSMFLTARSGLDRLDQRLTAQGFNKTAAENMDFYQKYDLLGLNFLYVRSYVHIERLDRDQLDCLLNCLENRGSESAVRAAADMMEQTFRHVLAVSPENPDQQFQLFPSVDGSGLVAGRAILVGLKSVEDYDSQGMIRDQEADRRRIQVFFSVKGQLEPILSKALSAEVTVLAQV